MAIRRLEGLTDEVVSSIDLFFVLVCGILCFLLQAGFGLLEVGSVRSKNAQNIMLKNIMDACVSAIAYWACGWAFAYGPDGDNVFIGSGQFFLADSEDYIVWFFNYVFAGTTATIVSGAVAERCQFRAYLVYSIFLSGFLYPVVTHWIWDTRGFLFGRVYDFAGSGGVHMVGGAAAMAGSLFLGPRKGKFIVDEETGKKKPVKIPGHNTVLAALGALILWFGFFAFNGGSSYAIAGEASYVATGRAVVVTTIAGASGGCTLLIWGYITQGMWDVSYAINGLLAGMIATCSGANALEPWAGFLVGVLGACGCQLQIILFEYVLFIDDPLNASAVHMGAGIVGMLYVAFLASPRYVDDEFVGVFYGGDALILGYQIMGIVVYFAWAFGLSSIMFFTLAKVGWFRVSEEEEEEGMDLSHHGGKAYPLDKTEEAPLTKEIDVEKVEEG